MLCTHIGHCLSVGPTDVLGMGILSHEGLPCALCAVSQHSFLFPSRVPVDLFPTYDMSQCLQMLPSNPLRLG